MAPPIPLTPAHNPLSQSRPPFPLDAALLERTLAELNQIARAMGVGSASDNSTKRNSAATISRD